MSEVCDICGNDRAPGKHRCIFCGAEFKIIKVENSCTPAHRIVNIEAGMPLVDTAIARLERELDRARTEGIAALTVIHGYGASGRGGRIRVECRKMLEYLKEQKQIRGYIRGENFSRKNGQTKSLLRRLPLLGKSSNLNKANKGITIIEL